MRAFCYRSGEIEFGTKIPEGALQIGVSRSATKLRKIVENLARRGYDGKTLLVPGLPEAANESEAVDATRYIRECITMRLAGKPGWPTVRRASSILAAA